MFKKAKALLLATAISATSIVSLSPNANAVNGNNYDWWEKPFRVIPYSYQGRPAWEKNAFCNAAINQDYQYSSYYGNSGFYDIYGNRIARSYNHVWVHTNNNHCVANINSW